MPSCTSCSAAVLLASIRKAGFSPDKPTASPQGNAATAIDGLQERESLGATGVGHGIALPHARLQDLIHIRAIFLRLERPLDYDSVDRQPVDLIFALFAPKDSGVDHLKALALVSRTMRDPGICAKLRANTDTGKLHAILTEALLLARLNARYGTSA